MPEPKILRLGKEFHRTIQDSWRRSAQGVIFIEKGLTKGSGKSGRMDIFVETESGENVVSIAEIKNTDWDTKTTEALRRNIARQVRQVWDYVYHYINKGIDVCPGVIFRRMPRNPDRLALIESEFNENGIQVVWDDESVDERRSRS